MSLLGALAERNRVVPLAERCLERLALGEDTPGARDRAERLCRRAAVLGLPDDQFRLAGFLFNRVAVESMTSQDRARRCAEALILLDALISLGYEPAAELRPYVLKHCAHLIVFLPEGNC